MSRNAPARVILAVLIGSTTEFYDFFIYGTAAALVFGRAFFPHLSSVNGLLAAFSVYAVGFLGRPTGAVLFGHLGDRVGRRRVLIASLLLMGLSTVGVGLLPGYDAWGGWAPVTLTGLRFLQGVGLGGEFGGAALLAVEHAPADRRGRYGAYVQLGPCLGFAVATGLFWSLSRFLPEADFLAWGWRLPFLASAGLVALGLVARIGVEESPVFLTAAATARAQADAAGEAVAAGGGGAGSGAGRAPLATVLRYHLRPLLLGAGTVVSGSVFFYVATTWALSHATGDLHMSRTLMLELLLVANVVLGGATYVGARLSDRYGRRTVIRWGMAAALLWALPLVPLLDTARPSLVLLGLTGAMLALGLLHGPVPAFLPELFPAGVRCSGSSVSYNLGALTGGALAPLIATRLTAVIGSYAVGWYLVAACCCSLLCLRALAKQANHAEPVELLATTPEAISYSGQ
jgi:MFS family permease